MVRLLLINQVKEAPSDEILLIAAFRAVWREIMLLVRMDVLCSVRQTGGGLEVRRGVGAPSNPRQEHLQSVTA